MEERSDLLLPHINECRHDIFKLIKNCRPLLHKTVEVYHQKVEQYVTEIDKSIAFLRTCNIINAFYSTDAIWDEVEKNLRDERNETGEKKYSDDDIENGRKMTHAILDLMDNINYFFKLLPVSQLYPIYLLSYMNICERSLLLKSSYESFYSQYENYKRNEIYKSPPPDLKQEDLPIVKFMIFGVSKDRDYKLTTIINKAYDIAVAYSVESLQVEEMLYIPGKWNKAKFDMLDAFPYPYLGYDTDDSRSADSWDEDKLFDDYPKYSPHKNALDSLDNLDLKQYLDILQEQRTKLIDVCKMEEAAYKAKAEAEAAAKAKAEAEAADINALMRRIRFDDVHKMTRIEESEEDGGSPASSHVFIF